MAEQKYTFFFLSTKIFPKTLPNKRVGLVYIFNFILRYKQWRFKWNITFWKCNYNLKVLLICWQHLLSDHVSYIVCYLLEAMATGFENGILHHMSFIQSSSEGFFHSSVQMLYRALYSFEEYSTTYLKCKRNFTSNAF